MVYLTVTHAMPLGNHYNSTGVNMPLSDPSILTYLGYLPSYHTESADPERADAYEYVILTSITFAVLNTLCGISSRNASSSNRFVGPETLIAPSG